MKSALQWSYHILSYNVALGLYLHVSELCLQHHRPFLLQFVHWGTYHSALTSKYFLCDVRQNKCPRTTSCFGFWCTSGESKICYSFCVLSGRWLEMESPSCATVWMGWIWLTCRITSSCRCALCQWLYTWKQFQLALHWFSSDVGTFLWKVGCFLACVSLVRSIASWTSLLHGDMCCGYACLRAFVGA